MNTSNPRTALTHEEVFELLPFHANGSLRGDELAAVQAHVGSCLICRRELAIEQRTVHAFREGSLVEQSAQAAFHRLLQDIRSEAPKPPPRTGLETWKERLDAWLLALTARPVLAAAPLVVAVTIGVTVLHHHGRVPENHYRVLASRSTLPAPRAGELRIVFSPELDPARIPGLLASLKLEVVAGPNSAGAYTVRTSTAPGELAAALASLRARPEIALAEPASPLAVERPQ